MPAARREVAESAYSRWMGEGGGNVTIGRPRRPESSDRAAAMSPASTTGDDVRRCTTASVVIAAITSCTNTSNPSVMIGAGLARARRRSSAASAPSHGSRPAWPRARAWSPTISRGPACSRTSTSSASTPSATAAPPASATAARCPRRSPRRSSEHDLVAAAVLSGNRNFEGRVTPQVRANYLASPPLVVAYALAGPVDIDLDDEPLGTGDGRHARSSSGHLADAGRRSGRDGRRAQAGDVHAASYGEVFDGDEPGRHCRCPRASRYAWDAASTYVQEPPFFDGLPPSRAPLARHQRRPRAGGARRLGHHRPHLAGRLDPKDGPAGQYLMSTACQPGGLQQLRLAARQPRGDDARHLRQRAPQRTRWSPAREGGWTAHLPDAARR